MDYDFCAVEEKWQKRWAEARLGEAEPDDKPHFFIIFAYPNPSGFLHIGHMRGFTYADIMARYKRMNGFNVLFPTGVHATGNAAIGAALKVERGDEAWLESLRINGVPEKTVSSLKKPENVVEFFSKNYLEQFRRFGFLTDERRFTHTIAPAYQKFIEWQFFKLREKGLLFQAPYYATACVRCGPVAVDPSEMELSKGGRAEKLEYVLLKFRFGGAFLVAATLRPETVYGQTNLWVNPDVEYAKARVGNETWIVSKECVEKLKNQKPAVQVVGSVKGRQLVGCYATAPGVNRDIIILPAGFCDPKMGTGIVTSVPSDAPYDYAALHELQRDEAECRNYGLDSRKIQAIDVIPIIGTKRFGDKAAVTICEELGIRSQDDGRLEEATQLVYGEGFHKGVMNKNCGKYAGMPVSKAKELVKQELADVGQADILHDLSEGVVCRCGSPVIIKRVEDQWFINYADEQLKQKTKKHAERMSICPDDYKKALPGIIDWYQARASTRLGKWLGTRLPFDSKWTIEPIADSTIYPAYYVISKYVNAGDLKADELTEEFFDHVFLGKGEPKNKKWAKIREDFEYWYPLSLNVGGKEHQTVHFPVFLMMHAAIFDEPRLPRGIFVNWWMTAPTGAKFSKSKGGVEAAPHAAQKYGADSLRLYYCHAGSPFADVDWDEDAVTNYKGAVLRFLNTCYTLLALKGKKRSSMDAWLESKFNQRLKTAHGAMEAFDFRKAVDALLFEFQKDLNRYAKRGGNNAEVVRGIVAAWVKSLAPFIPHACEEVWEKLGGKPFASAQAWPTVYEKLVNPKAELAEEVIAQLEQDLENLLKLTGIKPKKITIFAAPEWKRAAWQRAREAKDPSQVVKTLMQAAEFKKRGEEAAKYAAWLSKNWTRLGEVLTQEEEVKTLEDAAKFFAEQTNAKVEVVTAEKSAHAKARAALPGKPAVLLE